MNGRADWILADAHVHLYPCFDVATVLRAAHTNFAAAARRVCPAGRHTGVLMLSETARDACFERLVRGAGDEPVGGWRFSASAGPGVLVAAGEAGERLLLVAGRQIVTEENLEVLALGTPARFEDGRPVREVLHAVHDTGAMPVLPWGFGKWTGGRAAILRELLGDTTLPRFALGDNGGRLNGWPLPSPLASATHAGRRVLPGSDPLPFESEQARVGSFGFALQAGLDPAQPVAGLKRLLDDPGVPLRAFGSLTRPWRFVRNQVAMQLRKARRD